MKCALPLLSAFPLEVMLEVFFAACFAARLCLVSGVCLALALAVAAANSSRATRAGVPSKPAGRDQARELPEGPAGC